MLTGKQRAYLRKLANPLPSAYQVGKSGYQTEAYLEQIRQGLDKNELIKLCVLETAEDSPRVISEALCRLVPCEGVQVIGRKIVLYRKNPKKPVIELP